MSQVKAFFPVKAKNERKFLKIISNSVDDYCTEHSDANIKNIYEDKEGDLWIDQNRWGIGIWFSPGNHQ